MHPLDGLRIKLNRARQHLEELNTAVDEFMRQGDSTGVVIDFNFPKRECIVHARVPGVPPLEWAVIVGEVLYHLRSALDYLVWQLVLSNGNVPTYRTEFPIFKDSAEYQAGIFRRLAGVCDEAGTIIESLQPFNTGQKPEMAILWMVHELNNAYKHRMLVPAQLFLMSADYEFSSPTDISVEALENMQRGPLIDGAQIAHFRWAGSPGPSDKMDVQLKLSFDVTFKQASGEIELATNIEDATLVYFLDHAVTFVERTVLPKFERFF